MRSSSSEKITCPVTTVAIIVALPSLGTAKVVAARKNAPYRPPVKTHQGRLAAPAVRGKVWVVKRPIAAKTTVKTAPDTAAAQIGTPAGARGARSRLLVVASSRLRSVPGRFDPTCSKSLKRSWYVACYRSAKYALGEGTGGRFDPGRLHRDISETAIRDLPARPEPRGRSVRCIH
jgi:hypothetical protein